MRTLRWLLGAAVALLLVQVGSACIEELDLGKMVSRTDHAIHGTITDVSSTTYSPAPDVRLIYTILTIQGEDLYTGEQVTREAAFVGGTYHGESQTVTSMPAPSEYRLGNDVVVFSGPVEGWGPEIDHCVYAAMGGIFRTVDTKNGTVVLGKGEGFAVDHNITVADLKQRIHQELVAQNRQEVR